MKRIIIATAAFAFLSALLACKNDVSKCDLVPAKVLRYDCDRIVFQLLTNVQIGDTNWQDVQTGINYTNVVSYYNTCSITKLTNSKMDTLYVSVRKTTENLHNSDCMQCLLSSVNPPHTKVNFVKIRKTPCEK